jgi:arylsulfatase A-like enzyme
MAALLFIRLEAQTEESKLNVLSIISDDLTSRALSCYGTIVYKAPKIDRIAVCESS